VIQSLNLIRDRRIGPSIASNKAISGKKTLAFNCEHGYAQEDEEMQREKEKQKKDIL